MSGWKLRVAVVGCAAAGILGACLPACAKDKEVEWQPIAPEELALKDNPLNPGAPAMILYREMITNDAESYETHYYRIKVFTDGGKKYADVKIPYLKSSYQVTDLRARTVHADGTIVNFEGQAFDQLVVKTRWVSVLAKTFTLPDVQVGSVLEYRYTIRWDTGLISPPRWFVQHELFTRKAHFAVTPYLRGIYNFHWVYFLSSSYPRPQQDNKGTVSLDVENVPGTAVEQYMPPEDEVKGRVLFYYSTQAQETPEQFWKRVGKSWFETVEDFIGKKKAVQQEAAGVAADPQDVRLHKLYVRAQQIRNLSYESTKSEKEAKQENLKDNNNIEDVLKHGYGYRNEINRLFVGLARAAGFEAQVVRIAERDDNFFHYELLDAGQLTGEVAWVRDGAQELYLDPGTPYCPLGLLAWEKTGVRGIKLDPEGGSLVRTPNPLAAQAMERRQATLRLDEEGTVRGALQITYGGQEALKRRLDAKDKDEAGRRKAIKDEIGNLLPSSAELKLGKISGLEVSEGSLTVEATVEIPGFGTATGRRLLLPLGLFQFNNRNPFSYAQRTNPVYFPYPFEERDEVDLEIPPGIQVESLPAPQAIAAAFGDYEISRDQQANHVRLRRHLLIGGVIFAQSYYPELRGFYDKVAAGDGAQAVVRYVQMDAK